MHNIAVQYSSGFGLELGGDYTRFTSDNNQTMLTQLTDNSENAYTLTGGSVLTVTLFMQTRNIVCPIIGV